VAFVKGNINAGFERSRHLYYERGGGAITARTDNVAHSGSVIKGNIKTDFERSRSFIFLNNASKGVPFLVAVAPQSRRE